MTDIKDTCYSKNTDIKNTYVQAEITDIKETYGLAKMTDIKVTWSSKND